MSQQFNTSVFTQAMDRQTNLTEGENGALEHISSLDCQVDLFFALVRNIPEDRLNQLFDNAVKEATDLESKINLFVLIFQTRYCRGGKGEKKLFYKMFLRMYNYFPKTMMDLLPLVPLYGYYKDYFLILEMGPPEEIVDRIITILANQLHKDDSASKETNPKLSLCAKFAPSEGKYFATGLNKRFYNLLVNKMFPYDYMDRKSMQKSRKQYRQLLSRLRKVLEIPEILMCAKKYEEIQFSKVPSLCMNRNRKAFLNEIVSSFPKNKRKGNEEPCHDENGNRYPNDNDRVNARHNLINLTKEVLEGKTTAKLCGKQLMPHELVSQLMKGHSISSAESDLYDAQWTEIRKSVLISFEKEKQEGSVSLGKMIPLVDVSGSMAGTPMEVAIALGILVSEVTHPTFRDRFITFHECPSWVSLQELATLKNKVDKTRNAPWGGSTNFEAAFELILNVAITEKIPASEMPDSLIVFSDMQFDQASNHKTTFELMSDRFTIEGYTLPKIIFWNLRGDTYGFPVTSDTKNVQMLSGFSPLLLKLVLDGEPINQEEDLIPEVTSLETYRKVIYDESYDPVREAIRVSAEII